jgi:hypothetical protein
VPHPSRRVLCEVKVGYPELQYLEILAERSTFIRRSLRL